jgi:hypothetical protein
MRIYNDTVSSSASHPQGSSLTGPVAAQPNVSPGDSSKPHLVQTTFPGASVPDAYRGAAWLSSSSRQKRDTPSATSHNDFAGLPAESVIAAPSEGMPDLAKLPKLTSGHSTGFKRASTEFWDKPGSGELVTRRVQQQNRLSSELEHEVKQRVEAGELSVEAKGIVDDQLHGRRDAEHGLYTLKMGSGKAIKPLNGVAFMTQKTAGYSYTDAIVKDRLDQTGTTVLYIPGRDGTLQEFANARQALDWFDDQLRNNADFRGVMLAKQAPQNQRRIADAIDKQESSVFADRMSGNLPEAMVQSQINTWKAATLNPKQGSWLPASGLDVTRSDESRDLERRNADIQLVRDRLPERLKKITFSDAEKQDLQKLSADIRKQNNIARRYYGDMPSFNAYAESTIRQRILKDKNIAVDPSAITVTIPTRVKVPIPGTMPPNSPTIHGSVSVSLTEVVAQQLLNTASVDWDIGRARLSGSGAQKLDIQYVKLLQNQMELEENYANKIHKTFDEPAAPEKKKAFGAALSAVKLANAGKMHYDAWVAKRIGDITEADYRKVMDVVDCPNPRVRRVGSNGKVTQAYGLTLDGSNGRHGVSLRDITVFGRDGDPSMVVHTPNAPDGKAFRRYDNREAFMRDLRRQVTSITRGKPESWSPMTRYWVSQFGAHQLSEGLPWLKSIAKSGIANSKLERVRIGENFFQHQYDYRVRHLLNDADASGRTDNEVAGKNFLNAAETVYRIGMMIGSMFAPGYIVAPLAMSEVASNLFRSYQAYSQGDKQAAGEALLGALTSVPVPGARSFLGGIGRSMSFRGHRRLPLTASGTKLSLQPSGLQVENSLLKPVTAGKYKGLYLNAANPDLYAKLNGEYARVYIDKQTGDVHVGDPAAAARSGFSGDPVLQRSGVTGDWLMPPKMGMHAGSPWWKRDGGDFDMSKPITAEAAQKKAADTWKIAWSSPEEGFTYDGYVFRGDTRESETVFREGFKPRTPIPADLDRVNGFNGGFGGDPDALGLDGKGISTSAFYNKDNVGAYVYGEGRTDKNGERVRGYTYLIDARGMKGFHLYRNWALQGYRDNPGNRGSNIQPTEINYIDDIPANRIIGVFMGGREGRTMKDAKGVESREPFKSGKFLKNSKYVPASKQTPA